METAEYLYTEVLQNTRCLLVSLDAGGIVTQLDCPWGNWAIEDVETGSPLPLPLRAILDATPDQAGPEVFPFVYLDEVRVVDVHVRRQGNCRQLILRDVSDIHLARLTVQQKAHEVSLLHEKQSELNRQLELQRAELTRANQAKSRFIASMSHEFRTPITSIMGHADMLAREMGDAALPAAIQRASWHLLTLVENLLEQARQGAGTVHLNPGRVDVTGVLGDMRELFSLQAENRGLELNVAEPAEEISLGTDELRLRQVLINLLSNAIRYTDEGHIDLDVDVAPESLTFRVSDTGPGIDIQEQERIFQPFQRLNPNQQSGAGLGLAIARQLVDAMGGELVLESEPGRGSTFSFRLPVELRDRSGQFQDLNGLCVLLVDDDTDALDIYEVFLMDWGIQVDRASDLQLALELAGQRHYDLVITDLHLGEENGIDLLRFVRARHDKCRTMLCSGSGISSDWQERFGEFADEFLLKPVRPDSLRSAIQNALARER